jgi:hypothetical protein
MNYLAAGIPSPTTVTDWIVQSYLNEDPNLSTFSFEYYYSGCSKKGVFDKGGAAYESMRGMVGESV